jgi:hypothetical protein
MCIPQRGALVGRPSGVPVRIKGCLRQKGAFKTLWLVAAIGEDSLTMCIYYIPPGLKNNNLKLKIR